MLLLFLLISIFLKLNSAENYNILQRPISNTVLVSNRINNIIFAVTKNCSEESYKILLKGINRFDRDSWENDQKFKRTRVWTTNVIFGKMEKIVLTDRNDFDKHIKCQDCDFYNVSKVDDVENFVSQHFPQNDDCPMTAIKEYTLIATDICLISLNKRFYNATNECPKDFKRHGILMETKEMAESCKHQMTQNGEKLFVDIFSENNLNLDILNPYIGSMKAIYFSKPILASVNFLVFATNELNIPFNTVRCKLYDNSYQSCNNGIFYGRYLHINGNSQNFSEMIIPLYFNEMANVSANYFMENFYYLLSNKIKNQSYDENNCSVLEAFFLNARALEKYNVLLLEDPYPDCFKLDEQWNYSYKYMEILIIYSGSIKSSYSNETLKHVTFVEKSEESTSFCEKNNLCTVTLDSTITRSPPPSDENDTLLNKDPKGNATFSLWWPIGGVVFLLIFAAFILWLCKFGRKYKKLDSKTSSETSIFKTSISVASANTEENIKMECFKKQMTKENNKHWAMFLDAKNVVFNFCDVLGRGSNAIVYKAILKGSNSFHHIQKCRRTSLCVNCNVAIKLPTKFEEKQAEEFIREINFLMLLQCHPNIITFMGWTIFANTPALMTELADTNLLTYIQKNQNTPLKTILSILLQISQALEFIAEQGIIHRDVACRNILIIFDENNIIAKLADFGLCCLFGDTLTPRNSIYKRFPIKWLSIEALINCEFSEKSDVWAFGILCYETFSLGAVPYSDMSNSEMIEFLQSGQRLKCPMKTPHLIYDLMQNCWKKEPKDRPKFNEISFHLRSMLEKETANYGYLNLKTSSLKIIHI